MKKIILFGLVLILFAACSTNSNEVDSFTHIHGLEYSHNNEGIYLATHHGLVLIKEDGWELVGEPEHQHDFMGYTIVDENTMISSGHPSHHSNYNDPLGVIISHDNGVTWEPIALYEEVDFHVLHVNEGNSKIMYGIDVYNSDFYRSNNGGHNWELLHPTGLSEPVASVITLVSHPQSPEYLLAGTENGLYISEDGGLTWNLKEGTYSATALTTIDSDSEDIVAYLFGEKEGLFFSDDFGQTWEPLNFHIENDYILYISNHPNEKQRLVIGSMLQNIYETNNFGESWITLAEQGRKVE